MLSKATVNAHVAWHLLRLLRNFPFRADRIQAMQRRKLHRLLVHAFENIPFYRRRMDDAGFHPSSFRDLDDLQRLPPLTKEEYRRYTEEEVARNPEKFASWYHDSTSGSSGTPLRLVRTWPERAYMIAKWLREPFSNGYRLTDRTFRMVSPHRLQARDSIVQRLGLGRRDVVSYLATPREKLAAYLRSRPEFFYGNKTQVLQLALEIRQQQANIVRPRLYAVGAEVLDPNSMAVIWEVFGRDNFFETYGCEEMGVLAWQLLGDDALQFSHDTNVLELDDNGTINQQQGFCLITDLEIRSMPLIRYQLGDWLEAEQRDGLTVIRKIRGRMNDWLVWRDGSLSDYHGFYELMAARTREVAQFQIIQENLDVIRIVVVLNKGVAFDQVRTSLIRDAKDKIRADVEYVVTSADEIPADPSGKIRMIVSRVYKPGQEIGLEERPAR